MRKYSELSRKKKAFVDVFLQRYPESATTGYCTRPQIEETFFAMKESGTPVGYPMWMTGTKEYKTGVRGVYYIPVPGDIKPEVPQVSKVKTLKTGLTNPHPQGKIASASKQEVLVEEQEFEAELMAAGIQL